MIADLIILDLGGTRFQPDLDCIVVGSGLAPRNEEFCANPTLTACLSYNEPRSQVSLLHLQYSLRWRVRGISEHGKCRTVSGTYGTSCCTFRQDLEVPAKLMSDSDEMHCSVRWAGEVRTLAPSSTEREGALVEQWVSNSISHFLSLSLLSLHPISPSPLSSPQLGRHNSPPVCSISCHCSINTLQRWWTTV